MTPDRIKRDDGFTLVELVISIALMSLLASVISAAVVVTLRTSPAVADRADAAVNVQGLVTWLPQDVDSARPGSFDISRETAPGVATKSGCTGVDPGFNLLKVTWSETISSTVDYAASYRYVAQTGGGYIFRVYCIVGATPQVLKVSGLIPPWMTGSEPVSVILGDSIAPFDPDGIAPIDPKFIDSAKFLVRPVVGKTIVIDATTKNPNETLTTTAPTTTAPTPPTTAPNVPPKADPTSATIESNKAVTIGLSASDPDGGALTVSVAPVPMGWTITTGAGVSLVVTAPVAANGTVQTLSYTVTDPAGASASAPVTITVSGTAPNQPPVANPAKASTGAGAAVTVPLPATDPEGGAMTATFSGIPFEWTVTAVGLSATMTPAAAAVPGNFTIGYTARDPGGLTSTSTITLTVTPPPCVISTPVLSRTTVQLKKNNPDALSDPVNVTITLSGSCVGLALHYDTGAPNGQYVRNFGNTGSTRTVTLPNHPSPELWSAGTKALNVQDGSSMVIGTVNLQVTT